MYNSEVLKSLPNAQKSNARFPAFLYEFDIDGNKEKPVWKFLIHPRSLKFVETAEYTKIAPIAANVYFRQYQATSGATLQINDLILDTWCLGKSLKPLIDGIRALMKASTDQDKLAPLVLGFKWGSKRFAPCVLTNLQWEESKYLSGEPAKIQLSITLEEIPKPLSKAELEAREKKKQDILADRNQAVGKPRRPLTDRQTQDASAAAKSYLERNKDQFDPDIQAKISQGKYALKTDKNTGDVNMYFLDKNLGVVLRSIGDKVIANDKITTIPLKPTGTMEVLK